MSAPVVPITRCRFCGVPSNTRKTCCGEPECVRAYHVEYRARRKAAMAQRALEAPVEARLAKTESELAAMKRAQQVTERHLAGARARLDAARKATSRANARDTVLTELLDAAAAVLDGCKVTPKGPTMTMALYDRLEAALDAARGTR